jgi:hypothetical protein
MGIPLQCSVERRKKAWLDRGHRLNRDFASNKTDADSNHCPSCATPPPHTHPHTQIIPKARNILEEPANSKLSRRRYRYEGGKFHQKERRKRRKKRT